jgi:peptidoglycan/xylan/chitin deacetylase (PgdA/CDA1 family)
MTRETVAPNESAGRVPATKSERGTDRDFRGYGHNPPHPQWPGNARIAINVNLNYEGGGESCVADGDAESEGMLNDIGAPPYAGLRSPLTESVFEYGSRVGVWRVLRILSKYDVRASILGVVQALERNPDAAHAFVELGHEIVSHGYRWIDYHAVPEAVEREHMRKAIAGCEKLLGMRPAGWMTGRPGPNTRKLIVEEGGFLYDRDALNDELPYWMEVSGRDHLIIPYSYETNDNRFNLNSGFSTADDFATYMIDCFNTMYEEGADTPGLMSIGLHDRLIGRPGRAPGLARFLEHARKHDRVWFCRGVDIAEHWRRLHPPSA